MAAKDTQIGGNHYKTLAIQPIEYIFKNKLGYAEGNVVKYVTRWRTKNGVEDLHKAKHYLELLIQEETNELREAALRSTGRASQAGSTNGMVGQGR